MINPPSPTTQPRCPNLLFWRLLALAWAGLIYQFSTEIYGASFTAWVLGQILNFFHLTLSPSAFEALHVFVRKLAHFTEYAIFSLILYRCFKEGQQGQWHARPALWAVLIAALYALSDEFHQLFVPGRTASLLDSGIDTLGAAFAMLARYGTSHLPQAKSSETKEDKKTADVETGGGSG